MVRMGHFNMVPLNLTSQQCLQHSLNSSLIYIQTIKYRMRKQLTPFNKIQNKIHVINV